MPPVVEARGLTKRFGALTAVDGIALRIEAGICFGVLGPNGAGKTTTVKMIHCVSEPTAGKLSVFGLEALPHGRRIRARIGVCHQEDNLDPDFSVERNLLVFGRYFGMKRPDARGKARELLQFMGLWERRESGIRELSGGLKRRLMIARALMNDPDFLILDEPTTGLDPQSRHQVWDRIRSLRKSGKTILLTTHYMDEAQRLCDRLVIMDYGRILVEGPPLELVRNGVGKDVVEVGGPSAPLLDHVKESGMPHESQPDRLLVYTEDGDRLFREIAGRFAYAQCTVRHASLEDLFLKLTGRELRD